MNKEEKTEKFKDFQNLVLELEQKINFQKKEKQERIGDFQETIDSFKQHYEKELENRDKSN
jgi:hypothetical protein